MEIRLHCGVGGKMGSNKYGTIKRILNTRNSTLWDKDVNIYVGFLKEILCSLNIETFLLVNTDIALFQNIYLASTVYLIPVLKEMYKETISKQRSLHFNGEYKISYWPNILRCHWIIK